MYSCISLAVWTHFHCIVPRVRESCKYIFTQFTHTLHIHKNIDYTVSNCNVGGLCRLLCIPSRAIALKTAFPFLCYFPIYFLNTRTVEPSDERAADDVMSDDEQHKL